MISVLKHFRQKQCNCQGQNAQREKKIWKRRKKVVLAVSDSKLVRFHCVSYFYNAVYFCISQATCYQIMQSNGSYLCLVIGSIIWITRRLYNLDTLYIQYFEDNIKMYLEEKGWAWNGFIHLRQGISDSSCEYDNKPWSSVTCRELTSIRVLYHGISWLYN